MDELDFDVDTILEEGELVYSLYWDSGAPGAGADSEAVYLWDEEYFAVLSYEEEMQGPFATLREAIEACELNYVNESVEAIDSTELRAAEIAALLRTDAETSLQRLTINNEDWQRTGDGRWLPAEEA
ncbi:hypothetical protein [Kallotenue papyrolyticum]|uniref:hypothetical protein n=1 Tax=Kallotenue papyrolyticum TaxID=1325125 RepID=UPI0004786231|nr:hypothetical protein [Kallotenue papyrolyticum]